VQPLLEVSLGFLAVDVDQLGQLRPSAQFHHHHRRPSGQSSLQTSTLLEEHIIAFINREFWICTAAFTGTQAGRIGKHFFLPRDWVNLNWLEFATLINDGKILCPRNGEVAILSNGFNEVWRD
jgi:hypothetical protein